MDEFIRLDAPGSGCCDGAYFLRGKAHAELGEYKLAIKDYDEAIRLFPQFSSAFLSRGEAYAEMGQIERAMQDCNEAFRLDPVYLASRGDAYLAVGEPRRAIEDYDEALRIRLGPLGYLLPIYNPPRLFQ